MPNYFSDRTNATAGNKNLSLAEGKNISNSFSLFVPPTWREPRGGREGDALGWSSAAELGWAPGMKRAHGNQAALQRQLCPGAAPLQSAAGLRALPAGTDGRGGRQREVQGNWEFENS